MTRVSRVDGAVRSVAPLSRNTAARDAVLHVKIATPGAKVMLLPGHFRDAGYVRTHVRYVVDMGATKGEQHILRNLSAIERKLREIGADEVAIRTELRRIEGAVRAELWRQILLPESREA